VALNLAIDGNRYVDYCRNDPEVAAVIDRAQRIVVPFAVLAEVRAGFHHGTKLRQNEKDLARFLQTPRVQVLFADEATTHLYAAIYAELRAAGTPIPTNDIWIAALVIQHDLVLFTRDRHFECVPRLAKL